MPALPVALNDELQVWELRACWPSTEFHVASSAWSFVTLRDVGTTQAELVDAWRDSLETPYTGRRPDGFVLFRLVVVDVWPGLQLDYVHTYPFGGYSPDSTGDSVPIQCGPVISWRTGLAGRSYRGRTYWGPVRASDVPGGYHLVGDGLGAIRTFAFNMIRDFGPLVPISTPGFAIISRRHDGVLLDPPVFSRPESYHVDSNMRTVRTRNDNAPFYYPPH